MQIIPSMHTKSPESDHYRRGGVTVPRATRCNRRVAPGRLSPAAPSGRGHSDPAAGRLGQARPFAGSHLHS